jgi:hypothetical protein
MSFDNLESKVKAAQEAVKNVDKDLRKTAFEIVLKRLLEGRTPETARTQERILPEKAAQDESGEGDRFRLLHQQAPGDL